MRKPRVERSRCLCSELVPACWTDAYGRKREQTANLEEVWTGGATLGFEAPVPEQTALRFEGKGIEYSGRVVRCRADFVGYLVEMEFDSDTQWSRERYEPDHFFDPRSLAGGELERKNNRLLEDCIRHLSARQADAQARRHER